MENLEANMINTEVINPSYGYHIVGIVIVVLLCVGAFVTYQQWKSSPWWSDQYMAWTNRWNWRNTSVSGITDMGALQQVAASVPMPGAAATESTSERHQKTESWCFIGEDLTGRYCVKVPSDKACDSDRLYKNQKDCQLTPANHMPAGIVKQNGTAMSALSSLRFE